MPTQLTAIILTYNEAKHIADCLASLAFADHRIVFDSHSQDKTVQIATEQGAEVMQRTWDHYANQRNAALESVKDRSEWVLFVDADERVSPELAQEIREAIEHEAFNAWQVPRHNYIMGKLTKGGGWYPDYQTRLLRVGFVHYDPERQVHETVLVQGETGILQQPLTHYNYRDAAHFHEKQRKYVAYDAQILFDHGIQPQIQNYVLQPLRQFRWRFFTLSGYRDGWHGLRLCSWMAWYEYRKYRILGQLWQQAGDEPV